MDIDDSDEVVCLTPLETKLSTPTSMTTSTAVLTNGNPGKMSRTETSFGTDSPRGQQQKGSGFGRLVAVPGGVTTIYVSSSTSTLQNHPKKPIENGGPSTSSLSSLSSSSSSFATSTTHPIQNLSSEEFMKRLNRFGQQPRPQPQTQPQPQPQPQQPQDQPQQILQKNQIFTHFSTLKSPITSNIQQQQQQQQQQQKGQIVKSFLSSSSSSSIIFHNNSATSATTATSSGGSRNPIITPAEMEILRQKQLYKEYHSERKRKEAAALLRNKQVQKEQQLQRFQQKLNSEHLPQHQQQQFMLSQNKNKNENFIPVEVEMDFEQEEEEEEEEEERDEGPENRLHLSKRNAPTVVRSEPPPQQLPPIQTHLHSRNPHRTGGQTSFQRVPRLPLPPQPQVLHVATEELSSTSTSALDSILASMSTAKNYGPPPKNWQPPMPPENRQFRPSFPSASASTVKTLSKLPSIQISSSSSPLTSNSETRPQNQRTLSCSSSATSSSSSVQITNPQTISASFAAALTSTFSTRTTNTTTPILRKRANLPPHQSRRSSVGTSLAHLRQFLPPVPKVLGLTSRVAHDPHKRAVWERLSLAAIGMPIHELGLEDIRDLVGIPDHVPRFEPVPPTAKQVRLRRALAARRRAELIYKHGLPWENLKEAQEAEKMALAALTPEERAIFGRPTRGEVSGPVSPVSSPVAQMSPVVTRRQPSTVTYVPKLKVKLPKVKEVEEMEIIEIQAKKERDTTPITEHLLVLKSPQRPMSKAVSPLTSSVSKTFASISTATSSSSLELPRQLVMSSKVANSFASSSTFSPPTSVLASKTLSTETSSSSSSSPKTFSSTNSPSPSSLAGLTTTSLVQRLNSPSSSTFTHSLSTSSSTSSSSTRKRPFSHSEHPPGPSLKPSPLEALNRARKPKNLPPITCLEELLAAQKELVPPRLVLIHDRDALEHFFDDLLRSLTPEAVARIQAKKEAQSRQKTTSRQQLSQSEFFPDYELAPQGNVGLKSYVKKMTVPKKFGYSLEPSCRSLVVLPEKTEEGGEVVWYLWVHREFEKRFEKGLLETLEILKEIDFVPVLLSDSAWEAYRAEKRRQWITGGKAFEKFKKRKSGRLSDEDSDEDDSEDEKGDFDYDSSVFNEDKDDNTLKSLIPSTSAESLKTFSESFENPNLLKSEVTEEHTEDNSSSHHNSTPESSYAQLSVSSSSSSLVSKISLKSLRDTTSSGIAAADGSRDAEYWWEFSDEEMLAAKGDLLAAYNRQGLRRN